MITTVGDWRIESYYDYVRGGIKYLVFHDDRDRNWQPSHIGPDNTWTGFSSSRRFETYAEAEEAIAAFQLANGG